MNAISNNIIRQILLILFILVLGYVLFMELKFFLPSFLGAYTLYVIMRKYMFEMEAKYKWKKWICATILMVLSFLVILVPVFTLINLLIRKLSSVFSESSNILQSLKNSVENIEKEYGLKILTAENINKVAEWGAGTVPQIVGATFNSILSVVIMYFILYFMLTEARKMEAAFNEWIPLKDENILVLRRDMNKLVLSNAIGIPLIAISQGIVGLIGYIIIGVPEPLFWFVITCIAGMLPVVGAALAYVPLGILTITGGETAKGIILLIFGFGVIGTVDNVFRFWLQKKLGDVHPLITIFGVIIGVSLFGFIGLIFGPILIALFLLMIKLYASEFGQKKSSKNNPIEPVRHNPS
jgi:predicted PurR-regulated permease PerM